MKIAFIPIDNRPICYDIIKDILSINSNIELFMPDIKYLGGLRKSADIDNIFEFIKKLDKIDYFIVCLDTLAYGGLIPSRRVGDSFDEIKKRILKFRESVASKSSKILAFSSIMRISNNNINEEEKTYWNMLKTFNISPQTSIMFDDSQTNLKTAHDIGMKTVWISTNERDNRYNKISDRPDFCDYQTDDLVGFLTGLLMDKTA